MKLSWIMLIGGALLANSVHSKQKKYVTVPIVSLKDLEEDLVNH